MRVMSAGLSRPYTNFKAQLTILNANKDIEHIIDDKKEKWESRAERIGTERDNIYLMFAPQDTVCRSGLCDTYTPIYAYATIKGQGYYDDISVNTKYKENTKEYVPRMTSEGIDDEVVHFMDTVEMNVRSGRETSRLHCPR